MEICLRGLEEGDGGGVPYEPQTVLQQTFPGVYVHSVVEPQDTVADVVSCSWDCQALWSQAAVVEFLTHLSTGALMVGTF